MNPTHACFPRDGFDVFAGLSFSDFAGLLGEDVGGVGLVTMVMNIVDEAWVLGAVEDVVFDGDDSCLLSLAGDDEFVLVPVDIVEFEVAELADTHTGVGEEVDDCFGAFACAAAVADA